MTSPPEALALGDQVQQVCDASGLPVLGFMVMLVSADGQLWTEARSRSGQAQWDALLRAYLDAQP